MYMLMYPCHIHINIYVHAGVQTFDFHEKPECLTGDGFALEAALRFRRVQEEQALDKGILALADWTSKTKTACYKRHSVCRS